MYTLIFSDTWHIFPAQLLMGVTLWVWQYLRLTPLWGPMLTPLGVPMIYHNEDSVVGCLDQTYFKDPETGRDYIIWKTDDILPVIRTGVIYIQEIEEGGTAFAEGSEKSAMILVDR